MSDAATLYPKSMAALRRMMAHTQPSQTGAFVLGPSVLRAPASRVRATVTNDAPVHDDGPLAAKSTDALLGELTDMVLVSADDAHSGRPEVHLQFKGDVIEGLHLRLVKEKDGLAAFFVVQDALARRAVEPHVEALVARLRERGFSITSATLTIA